MYFPNFSSGIFILMACIAPVFIFIGWLLKTSPPAQINGLYGYRTRRSMKDQQRWDFAQTYCGEKMFRSGIYGLFFAITGLFLPSVNPVMELILALALMLVVAFLPVWQTEKALKKKFDQ